MISKFIDRWGLLDKTQYADGGDTCQREGMYFSLKGMQFKNIDIVERVGLLDRYIDVMDKLHVAPGVFIRHMRPLNDVDAWDRMSRDQLQSMIIAAGYWSKVELKKILKGHLLRGLLFTTNTRRNGVTRYTHGRVVEEELRDYGWKLPDLTFFEIWGNFIRSFNAWYLWPLLVFLDLELLLGSIKWRYFPKHNIAMNQALSVMQAMDRLPTPLSYLAEKIMPIESYAKLIGEHFNDFEADMIFFEQMFLDARKKDE